MIVIDENGLLCSKQRHGGFASSTCSHQTRANIIGGNNLSPKVCHR